ncbi:hypothetical protein TanjilG_23784 [Lupinus angustifolius]|nr:hypothetical protein TanjilG_23784 [Lupinus angustifolius]
MTEGNHSLTEGNANMTEAYSAHDRGTRSRSERDTHKPLTHHMRHIGAYGTYEPNIDRDKHGAPDAPKLAYEPNIDRDKHGAPDAPKLTVAQESRAMGHGAPKLTMEQENKVMGHNTSESSLVHIDSQI